MGKINLLIASEDVEYLELLTNYIRCSSYGEKLLVRSVTRKSNMDLVCQQQASADVLLVQSEWMDGTVEAPPSIKTVVLLVEQLSLESEGPYRQILKYQPLDRLLDELTTIHSESGGSVRLLAEPEGKAMTIAVYSTVGGCGKTTVAVNLAKHLALLGSHVFYLNLEWLNGGSVFAPGRTSDRFAQMLYYAKAGRKQAAAKLDTLKSTDPLLKFDYFEPPPYYSEMEQMGRTDTEELIAAISESGHYDIVIVDLESSMHERVLAAIGACSRVVWLLSDDLPCIRKTDLLLDEYKRRFGESYSGWLRKVVFAINGYTGSLANGWQRDDARIRGFLPYIPGWKTINRADQLLSSPVFAAELMKLCGDWGIQGRAGEHHVGN